MSSPNSPIKSSSSRLAVLFGSSSMLLFCFAMMIMMSAGPIKSVEAGWNLEWSDDFSGTSLDKSKWQVEVMCWAGNGERQCYTDRSDNVYVTGGNLHLKAKKENYRGSAIGCTNNNENSCTWTKPTTSGRIRSKFAVDGSWKYGRFEVRARLPRGDFLWPAIWMLPTDEVYGGWPRSGEIDIMEARGQNPTKTSSAVHFGDPVPNNKHTASGDVESPSSVDLTAGFHVYSAEWDASAIKFFVDGKLKWTQSLDRSFGDRYNKRGAPFDQRFHFVMNLAVGGKFFNEARYGVFDANRDPRTWSQPSLIVDYARAYKWVNGDSSPTTQSTPAPSSPPPSSATCTKDTIVTSEDTFFDSGRPTLNFGKDQLLLVRKTGAKIRQAFLKFQLPSSASPSNLPTKATLELFGSGEEADGVMSVKINAAPISWSADSMTYESRPASCTNNCFSSTLSTGQNPAWREVNILNLVRDAISRRQTHVSVALSLDQDGYASFNSLEAGTGLPKLSLEFGKCS